MQKKSALALALVIGGGFAILQTLLAIRRARQMDEQGKREFGEVAHETALKVRRTVLTFSIAIWIIAWSCALIVYFD